VNFHNSGKYSCEVVADRTFLTLIKEAHMQVVGKALWRRECGIET
jgi:hypothetical protein